MKRTITIILTITAITIFAAALRFSSISVEAQACDRTKIVFTRLASGGYETCVMNRNGSDQTCFDFGNTYGARVSPDAGTILFIDYVTDSGERLGLANIDGTDERLLFDRLGMNISVITAEFSPDGSRIAFVTYSPTSPFERTLWTIDADGTDLTSLYTGEIWFDLRSTVATLQSSTRDLGDIGCHLVLTAARLPSQ